MKKLTILILLIFIFSTLLDAKACKELKSCEEASNTIWLKNLN